MVPLFYFKESIAVVWGVGKPDMAVAEGGDRRSRWISNDYAAFGAVWRLCENRRCQLKRLEQHWLSQIVLRISDLRGYVE